MKKLLLNVFLLGSTVLHAQGTNTDVASAQSALRPAANVVVNTPPVRILELVSFEAVEAGAEGVLLRWSTATERAKEHFFVERSHDRVSWETALEVDGIGGNEYTPYEIVDKAAFNGASYYRLRTLENGARTELSDVYSVDHEPSEALLIHGDGAPGRFTVTANGTLSNVQLLNNRGQFVPMPLDYQDDRVRVNAELVEPGTYYVQAMVNGSPVLRPVIITSTMVIGG